MLSLTVKIESVLEPMTYTSTGAMRRFDIDDWLLAETEIDGTTGPFRATDETLRTSEYVYRRMAGYKLSHMLLMRQMADLTGTPIERMSVDAVVHPQRAV